MDIDLDKVIKDYFETNKICSSLCVDNKIFVWKMSERLEERKIKE